MNRQKVALMAVSAVVGGIYGALMVRKGGHGASLGIDPTEWNRVYPAIALWFVFFVYWSIAARDQAPTKSSEKTASTVFHQVALNVALLLLVIPVPGLTGRLLPASGVWIWAGAAVQAGFMLLAVWARRHLGRNWSAEVRIAVEHQLVRTGPYKMLRHPIYTAMLGMFLGTAISSGEVHSLIALAMMAALYWRKTRLEEQILGKTFPEYDSYKRVSWALVPLIY